MDSPDADCDIYKAALYESIGHEIKGDDYRNSNLFAQGKDSRIFYQCTAKVGRTNIVIPVNLSLKLLPSTEQRSKRSKIIIMIVQTCTARLQSFYAVWENLRWHLKRIHMLLKSMSYRLDQNTQKQ